MSEYLAAAQVRLKRYVRSLPLLTKAVIGLIIGLYVLKLFFFPVNRWFALDPAVMNLGEMHRLNTYPLVHLGLYHMLFNVIALTPLLERFEKEHGTLSTLIQILGPITTFPGALYLAIDYLILRTHTPVEGASAWVFTFLANEALRSYRVQPHFSFGGFKVPTWSTPLITMFIIAFLVPNSSMIGHFCGILAGYAFPKYLIKLAPPEWILKKVEAILPLHALPHYIGLDNRQSADFYFILPHHSETDGLEDGREMAGGPSDRNPFSGSGQRLGQ